MSDYIRKLIESRNNDSIKKRIPLKLSVIAETLGSQITHQFMSDDIFSTMLMAQSEEIETLSEDTATRRIGYIFDSLSSGTNIEITYMVDQAETEGTMLKCRYQGYLVFHEEHGELQAYVPHESWEQIVDRLYAKALDKKLQMQEVLKEEMKKKMEKEGHGLLEKLRNLWGLQ